MNMKKRGQVTIYIIIAIIIVGVVLISLLFRPQLEGFFGGDLDPNSYLKSCIQPVMQDKITELSKNAGYVDMEGSVMYRGDKYKYLCYIEGNYQTCIVQQPMIKANFEKNLKEEILPVAENCARNLKDEYEKRGYGVSMASTKVNLEIVPDSVRLNFESPMTVTKDTTRTYEGFEILITSEIYDLSFISQSIIDYESTFGDSETSLYIQYYPDLKIEKIKLSDGTTIYKVSNVVTKEEIRFASRSLAWPPGYAE